MKPPAQPAYEYGPLRPAIGFPWVDEHRTLAEIARRVPSNVKVIAEERDAP